jgi:poly-gamma-glutamate capsule biosynthesis protein CapA/YwtB (metallophosphatase superfamily)
MAFLNGWLLRRWMVRLEILFIMLIFIYVFTCWKLSLSLPDIESSASSLSSSSRDGITSEVNIILPVQATIPNRTTIHGESSSGHQKLDEQKEGRPREDFCLTFVGDTMFKTINGNYAQKAKVNDSLAFDHIKSLFQTSDAIIGNLEGPISAKGTDPRSKVSPAYSFGMDPSVMDMFQALGNTNTTTHWNRANNHYMDRGVVGIKETRSNLQRKDLAFFGLGTTQEKCARPLIIATPWGQNISVTGFADTPGFNFTTWGTMRVKKFTARLGVSEAIKHAGSTALKIAFPHWGKNYKDANELVRNKAKILAQAGYDMIIGSDGSHTAQRFEWLDPTSPTNATTATTPWSTPVLYDTGNFVFHTPGRFSRLDALPYGMVVHLKFRKQRLWRMELHCIVVDNLKIHYIPRICISKEAKQLFEKLGPPISYTEGESFGTVKLD